MNKDKDISKNILDKIEKGEVTLTPEWHFTFRKVAIYTFFSLAIIGAVLAISLTIWNIANIEWDLVMRGFEKSWWERPFFWLFFSLLFGALGWYAFTFTHKAYRYRTIQIILIILGATFFAGLLLHFSGLSSRAEYALQENIPPYQNFIMHRQERWVNPEEGRLAGEVIDLQNSNQFHLRDIKNNQWSIETHQNTRFLVRPKKGEKIRLIGTPSGQGSFRANEILPWFPGSNPHMGCNKDTCRFKQKK